MKLYRFVDWVDEPILRDFEVIKETKCGYWFLDTCKWPERKRWISKDGHYAHTTKEIALESYIERKKYQLVHLARKESNVLRFIKLAESMDVSQKLLTFKEGGF